MEVQVSKLRSIDLTDLSKNITNLEHKSYFLSGIGQEHYKLLAYYSSNIENGIILDIGTNRGCSSLALAYNPSNKVHSFDLYDLKELSQYPPNITYHIDFVTNPKYEQIVKDSEFILLDTFHDGVFEAQMYQYLTDLNWKGVLMLDDIHLNEEMKSFWDNIKLAKVDVTNVGHVTGTGLVFFR
jgi:hypothetical protein